MALRHPLSIRRRHVGARADRRATAGAIQLIVHDVPAVGCRLARAVDARDVAVTGATAVVATSTGITTVDVASPRAPRVIGQTAIAGGANGVTILSGAPITDRNGQSHAGPIALVASGGTSSARRAAKLRPSTPSSPTALGSTQLTNAAGQTPPAGVLAICRHAARDCRGPRRPRLCRDRRCRRVVGPDWTSDPGRRNRSGARRRRPLSVSGRRKRERRRTTW